MAQEVNRKFQEGKQTLLGGGGGGGGGLNAPPEDDVQIPRGCIN